MLLRFTYGVVCGITTAAQILMKYTLSIAALALVLLGAGCAPVDGGVSSTDQPSDTPTEEQDDVNRSGSALDLSNRGLTQVSQDVFKRTELVELDLSGNRLTGAIPAEIRLLNRLEVLDLSDNAMTGLPAEVGQLRLLRLLDLSNNQLTGLPLELGQLKSLKTLDLRGNEYAKQDLDHIRNNLPQTNILVD